MFPSARAKLCVPCYQASAAIFQSWTHGLLSVVQVFSHASAASNRSLPSCWFMRCHSTKISAVLSGMCCPFRSYYFSSYSPWWLLAFIRQTSSSQLLVSREKFVVIFQTRFKNNLSICSTIQHALLEFSVLNILLMHCTQMDSLRCSVPLRG